MPASQVSPGDSQVAPSPGPSTPAGREAWRILERGLLGYTFHPQLVVNGTRLEIFYCPELGVILELEDDASAVNEVGRLLDGLDLRTARVPAGQVNRPSIIQAIEAVVEKGRLWPED